MSKLTFKSKRMKGTSRCKVVREHNSLQEERAKTEVFDEVVAKKQVIREGLRCKAKLRKAGRSYTSKEKEGLKAAMARFLAEKYTEIKFSNQTTRQLHWEDAVRETFRFVDSEDRNLIEAYPMDMEINDVMVTEINPDYICINHKLKTIEIITICCSSPKLTQSGDVMDESVFHSLDMYNCLQYAKQFVPKGYIYMIKSSYYYLRKTYQYDNRKKGEFDPMFFNRDARGNILGGNVVSMEEEYFRACHDDNCLYNDGERPCEMPDGSVDKYQCPYMCVCQYTGDMLSPLDKHFKEEYKVFVEGQDKTECDPKKDCVYCQLNHICNYTFPPEVLNVEKSRAALSSLKLSKEQRIVTDSESGVILAMAGAGAGKTMSVSVWFMNLLDKGVDPEKMLGFSFTVASAEELKERVISYCEDAYVDVDPDKLNITTFNGFGNAIIQEHYEELGFEAPPQVIQDVTRTRIIANLLDRESKKLSAGLDYRNFDTDTRYCVGARAMVSRIFSIIKSNNFSLGQELEVKKKLPWNMQGMITTPTITQLFELYAEYDATLRERGLIEYADQQFLLFELLKINPTVFDELGFEYILVDEFQDTSEGQIQLIKELMAHKNFKELLVVGDASQAIYSFRDTTPEFILNLDKYIGKPVTQVNLVENYRSTPQIIDFANKINEKNLFKNVAPLIAKRDPGKSVVVRGFWDDDEQFEYCADVIGEHISDGMAPESIAFIGRGMPQLQKLGDILTQRKIPWVLLNPEKLMENSRIIAAVDFSKFYRQPTSVTEGRSYLNAILKNTLFSYEDEDVIKMTEDLVEQVNEVRSIFSPADKRDAYMQMVQAIDNEDEIFLSFIDTLNSFVSLEQILDYCDDLAEFGEKERLRRSKSYPGVVLTTAHSSKGLEWPVVINSLNGYDSEDVRKKQDTINEERRLMYVSATRARDELIITGNYKAYGNKRDGIVYNRYLHEAYDAGGFEFAPGEPPVKKKKEVSEEGKKKKSSGNSIRDLIKSKAKAKTKAKKPKATGNAG